MRKKISPVLKAEAWTQFGDEDRLYFLQHDHHCYVLLYIHKRKLAYIADGGNIFKTNQEIATELKQRLGIRLIPLEFSQQLKIDYCGSSAVLIGMELLKMHKRGIKFQELVASKELRAEIVTTLHQSTSKSVALPPLGKRRKVLTCEFCGKTYKPSQGRSLGTHIARAHKK